MPTLQRSTHHTRQPRARRGAGLIAMGALIAIAATVLFIALTGAGHRSTASVATHGAQTANARHGRPTLASVLAPLSPQERHYVLGIASMSDAQLAAAYGTGR